jgi:hypothetical protein
MKRELTIQEKRTIRFAAIGVALYLIVFYGASAFNGLAARREAYDKLLAQAQDLRAVVRPYEDKTATATNLMDRFRMDPLKLKRPSVLAEASAAIQQAAAAEKVGLGPIRETPGRASAKEIGSIQFEGTGQVPSVMGFLHHLERVGFPVIIDNAQFTTDPRMPNAVKISLTIVVLDYDAWKPKEENAHA